MRAKMSDPERSRFEAVEREHSTFEQMAEREARAILAETEPGQDGSYLPLTWFRSTRIMRPFATDLAESLAVFVRG